jgi:hypothetical protein
MCTAPRHQRGYPNSGRISTAKEHVGGEAHESPVRHQCSPSIWPNVRIMRKMRWGQARAFACGLARTVGDTILPTEADNSTDPGEISQFLTLHLDRADFRQENPGH